MSFRDGPFNDLKVPLTWTASAAVVVAVLIAAALLLSDRRETLGPEGYGGLRAGFDSAAATAGRVLTAPVRWTGAAARHVRGYFFAVGDNRRLRAELAEMRRWRDAAIALKDQNERYEALLRLRTEPPIEMVSGRLVTQSRGPFARSGLIDVGSEAGVRVGHPVMSEHGLVGRVVGVGRGVSRVLLLTDSASRTPVIVDRTNARAILTGDGSPAPRLAYLRGQDPVRAGDRVLTSGDGGVFPRGLPVGAAVRGVDGSWRVALYSERALPDYVRVLKFEDFTQLAAQPALSEPAMPPPPPVQAAPGASGAPAARPPG